MKIAWKIIYRNEYVRAQVGNIVMRCFGNYSYNSWTGDVSILEISDTMRYTITMRSLHDTKQCLQKMAEDMLLDYYVAIESELRNFTLLE